MSRWEINYDGTFGNKDNDNYLVVYAINLRFPDLEIDPNEAIVDNPNDKGVDVICVDRDHRSAIIAQCYVSPKPSEERSEAKATKAALLNQATAWLFSSSELSSLPLNVQRQAKELQNAIKGNEIDDVYLWYVHNSKEGDNARRELLKAGSLLRTRLKEFAPETSIEVHPEEIGDGWFTTSYDRSSRPIFIEDKLQIPVERFYEVATDSWQSISSYVSGAWLKELFDKYEDGLFSANLRSYLGSRRSDNNVNNGIKQTVTNAPEDFFAFNNGVTALVNSYSVKEEDGQSYIEFEGISIINGAQTTGAISSVGQSGQYEKVLVPIRFIHSSENELVERIVRFNNTQNKIEASDFRSNDSTQRRLVDEFEAISDVSYNGGRRGGVEDVIRRKNDLPNGKVAQAIAAFHSLATEAVRGYQDFWQDDSLYQKVFFDGISADHIVFCLSLIEAVQEHRSALTGKESLTTSEKDALKFLNIKGAQLLFAEAIAKLFDDIVGESISSLDRLHFKPGTSLQEATSNWHVFLQLLYPFLTNVIDKIRDDNSGSLPARISSATVQAFVGTIRPMISIIKISGQEPVSDFISKLYVGDSKLKS